MDKIRIRKLIGSLAKRDYPDKWELIGREDHYADEKNEFDYSFLDYRLKAE